VWRRAAKVSRPQLEVMAQTPSSEQRLYTSRQLRWARRQQDRLVLPAKFLAGIAWSGTTAGTGSSAIENNDACPAIFASVFRRFVGRNGMKFGVPRPRCAGLPSEALDENANQIGSACCRRFPFGFQAAGVDSDIVGVAYESNQFGASFANLGQAAGAAENDSSRCGLQNLADLSTFPNRN
jgi:hypothetical protein